MAEQDRPLLAAIRDFRRARIKADLEQWMVRMTGKPANQLSFEEVRQKLKGHIVFRRELKEIPLAAIAGSVDRYENFTSSFYPLGEGDRSRWTDANLKRQDLAGLPPIEVYQVGEVYFVIDGNRRVAMARELDAAHIEAHVTPVYTRALLKPGEKPDEVILPARYAEFLERTRLDELRPGADLRASVPGQYRMLDKHIELHRYFLELEHSRPVSYQEAVVNWYDEVYAVVVRVIREQDLLEDFPGRTETDLYLWVSGYRALLEEGLEGGFEAEETQTAPQPGPGARFQNLVSRLAARFIDRTSLDELETGPWPGQWRRQHLLALLDRQAEQPFRLFTSILVPVNGQEVGWYALYQALGVARREGGRLLGLHVVPQAADRDSEAVRAIKAEFNQRCVKAGIPGRLAIEAGSITDKICQRARWTDLIVLRLVYPPAPQPIARLSSGLHTLIRRCNTPLLAVPRNFVWPLNRVLLAYDGSPRAQEALYIATYLARRWATPLTVVTVINANVQEAVAEAARAYLEAHQIEATFVVTEGAAAEVILAMAETHDSHLIVMGGYSSRVREIVLGSAVDQVLRASRRPALIC